MKESHDSYIVVENYNNEEDAYKEYQDNHEKSLYEIQRTARKQERRKKFMSYGIIVTLGIFGAYLITRFSFFAILGALGFMIVGLVKFIYDKQAKKDGTFEPSFWEKR